MFLERVQLDNGLMVVDRELYLVVLADILIVVGMCMVWIEVASQDNVYLSSLLIVDEECHFLVVVDMVLEHLEVNMALEEGILVYRVEQLVVDDAVQETLMNLAGLASVQRLGNMIIYLAVNFLSMGSILESVLETGMICLQHIVVGYLVTCMA